MVKKDKSIHLNSEQPDQVPPTYEELNAFMGPSMLSPKYEYTNKNTNNDISPESPDSRDLSDASDASDADEDNRESKCNVSYKTDGSYAANTSSKDLKLYDMKCLLEKKRKAIYDKNREVKELATENPYLSSVVSDYDNIQGTVLEEKKTQKSALKILSKHIRDISENMKHDEFQLDRIREDQLVLMEEIDKLRKEISYIHDKIDGGLAHIKVQKPVNKNGNRRYDDDNDDDVELEEEPSDSYSSDYESSDDSSEGEYVYNGRY
jgi:hypothetical protein